MENKNRWTIFGHDHEILVAALANILSWFVVTFFPSMLPFLLPSCPEEEEDERCSDDETRTRCISIGRPGGMEQLRLVTLKEGICTLGYNVKSVSLAPYTPADGFILPEDCVVIKNMAFSVNYADCTIRWGLYESAKKFVGYPIVPGFDVAGTIERVPKNNTTKFQVGDRVFGCTLFGAYSNRVVIPTIQLRKIPDCIDSFVKAASFPAVSLTALYALHMAGYFPGGFDEGASRHKFKNKSILIHSAAGGVGSFLVQISRILGLRPIVGVVGSSSKRDEASRLGCDVVIDKSIEDLWSAARLVCPDGFSTVMDANGVSTLKESYNSLAPSGRLIVFGFHSNLPLGQAMLNPFEWIKMALKQSRMPRFDAMDLTVSNKSVLGFNLSFFAEEREVLSDMFDQILEWVRYEKLECPNVVEMEMKNVSLAHEFLQTGKSMGKIVLSTE